MREEGSEEIKSKLNSPNDSRTLPVVVVSYRLRNDENWLLECKLNHKELEALNPHHSSVYTCSCSYARNLRNSELGFTFEESLKDFSPGSR